MCWRLSRAVKYPKIPFCKKEGGSELERLVMLINHILNWSCTAASKKECLILKENPEGYLENTTWQPHDPLDRHGSLLATRAGIPWTKWALTWPWKRRPACGGRRMAQRGRHGDGLLPAQTRHFQQSHTGENLGDLSRCGSDPATEQFWNLLTWSFRRVWWCNECENKILQLVSPTGIGIPSGEGPGRLGSANLPWGFAA